MDGRDIRLAGLGDLLTSAKGAMGDFARSATDTLTDAAGSKAKNWIDDLFGTGSSAPSSGGSSGLPSWVVPVSIAGGAVLLLKIMAGNSSGKRR